MRVYSLFDLKMREYGPLVLQTTDESVVRALGEIFQGPTDSTIRKHPEDFDLLCIGEFDVENGRFDDSGCPRFVVNVGALKGGLNAER